MASTTNDALSELTTGGATKNEGQGLQPSNAVSTEIPVTVHASRYSSPSKGGGKLPPVREETRTVIIFPQGAVVRLSATVTPGELVVLTNQRTGTDAICRVTRVKTEPGIQNYVHLEFTQRALDFWQETSAVERPHSAGPSIGRPASSMAAPPVAPPAPTPAARVYGPPGSPAPAEQPPARTSVPPLEVKSAPAPLPKITTLADGPVGDSKDPVKALAADLLASEKTPTPASVPKQSRVVPLRVPRLESFKAGAPKKNSSKTIVLFAAAAVVLLAIGAVGGALLLRQDHGTILSSLASNPPATASLPAASESEAPVVSTASHPNALEAPASAVPRDSLPDASPARPAPIRAEESPKPIEPPKALQPPKPEVHPQPVNRTVPKTSARLQHPRRRLTRNWNSSEPPPVLPSNVNALPGLMGEGVSATMAQTNSLLPVQPTPPTPVKGGQLRQPKLLSSVAAAYPPLARTQRVQGDVNIDALIDATGKVAETNVISGNALLRMSAIDALRLWKYQPAMLNGEAIPIHIKVTITFHLH